MAHWEGDYVLDEELQIKWCKPTGKDGKVNGTELRELTEKIIFYSRVSLLYNCIIFYYLSLSHTQKNKQKKNKQKIQHFYMYLLTLIYISRGEKNKSMLNCLEKKICK